MVVLFNAFTMKKIVVFCLLAMRSISARGQFSVHYNPEAGSAAAMQYWKPAGDLFVGDCIPFFNAFNSI